MPRRAPATDRTVGVINLLAGHPNASFTLSAICRELNINKATVHPQLAALVEAGYLQRDPVSKTYRLGGALIAVGNAAGYRQFEVVEHAREEMLALARDIGVQCVASARFGMEIVMLARAGRTSTGLSLDVGRLPLVPPFGAVFMAWADNATREEWLQQLAETDTADLGQRYEPALEWIRTRGYGIGIRPPDDSSRWQQSTFPAGAPAHRMRPEEYLLLDPQPDAEYALNVIVAPIFGVDGQMIVALTIFDFPASISGSEVQAAADRLVQAARRVTKSIHGRSPLDELGQSTLGRLTI
jgi:DNA-binding IclR family transcriptional regulator